MTTQFDQAPGRYTSLQGKVAQILNARELAITIGEEHGVLRGMIFAVMAAEPLEIRDPDSQEVLDKIDREKVRVKATEVRPKVTICSTYRTKEVVTPGVFGDSFAGAFSSLSGPVFTQREVIHETLQATDASLPPPLPVEQSYVKPNDRVIQVEQNAT